MVRPILSTAGRVTLTGLRVVMTLDVDGFSKIDLVVSGGADLGVIHEAP